MSFVASSEEAGHGPVLIDVLEEHLEELEYLWEWRISSVFSETMTAAEMRDLEERAEAHLDGLLIGGATALDLARPKLTESPAEAAAASLLLLSADSEEELAAAVDGLSSPEEPLREAWRIAWRHAATVAQIDALEGTLPRAAAEPALRDLLIDILSFHRRPAPPTTNKWLAEAEGTSLGVFATAMGRFGGPWSRDLLERTLASGAEPVAEAGLRTSAQLGLPELDELCRRSLTGPRIGALVEMAGVLGDTEDLPRLEVLVREGQMAGPALRAMGRLGLPEAVNTLIEHATDPLLAPAALWAFRRITGEEILPEDAEPQALDPDEMPRRWHEIASRFTPGVRHQAGITIRDEEPSAKIHRLPLGARRDAYLRIRARDPKALPDLELEARITVQRNQSGGASWN